MFINVYQEVFRSELAQTARLPAAGRSGGTAWPCPGRGGSWDPQEEISAGSQSILNSCPRGWQGTNFHPCCFLLPAALPIACCCVTLPGAPRPCPRVRGRVLSHQGGLLTFCGRVLSQHTGWGCVPWAGWHPAGGTPMTSLVSLVLAEPLHSFCALW